MIRLAGAPLDVSNLLQQYANDPVATQVLRTMAESTATYSYDTLSELTFELRLRRELVNAARALNRSAFSFEVFHQSRANPKYWDRTSNGGFRLKAGASPSQAIEDIFRNGRQYATECATAMVIVYYKALLAVYGKELFDKLFPHIYLMNWHDLDPLLKEVGIPRKTSDFLPGDRAYFANPDVNPETPELQGENVIVLPDGLYYGHGMGIQDAETIVRLINQNRRAGATRSAYLLDAVSRADFKRLARLYDQHVPDMSPLVWKPFPKPIRSVY